MRLSSTLLRYLAIIGIILHAGLIVRHNAAMLGSHLQLAALTADLAEICHGAGGSSTDDQQQLPEMPSSGGDLGSCPICTGCISAVAVLPTPYAFSREPYVAAIRMEVVGDIITQRLARLRPPSRAPPSLA